MRYKMSVKSWALVGMMGLVGVTGCKSDTDKVHDVAQGGVERCLAGTGPFVEISFFDKTKSNLLREACEQPLGEVTMVNRIQGKIMSGPIEWRVDKSGDGGAWILIAATWENLARAQNFRRDRDATADEFQRAEESLAAAQAELPSSGWVRIERLRNLLDLRTKTLVASDPEPTHVGDSARKHYAETLAWAKEAGKADADAEARVMVVEHLRKYRNRQLSALDAIGSQDEWLEKSISEAIKEGNKEDAAKITAELAERRENAVKDRVTVQERIDTTLGNICAELVGLTADGVTSPELLAQITAAKSATSCEAKATAEQ